MPIDEQNNQGATDAQPFRNYIGTKIIRARPMSWTTFQSEIKGDKGPQSHNNMGYLVIYPNDYKSWSPKETFETAYREITQGEFELVCGEGMA